MSSDTYASSATKISLLVSQLTTAAKALENAVGSANESSSFPAARRELQFHTQKLSATLEDPNLSVWNRAFQVSNIFFLDTSEHKHQVVKSLSRLMSVLLWISRQTLAFGKGSRMGKIFKRM